MTSGGCAVLRHAADPPPKPILPANASLPSRASSYLGVFEAEGPNSYQAVADFAGQVGHQPNVALYFSGWGEAFQARFAATAWASGAATLVQINPYKVSLAGLAAGEDDGYLASFADAVRAFSHPVIIGFAHEMNGNWYPWDHDAVSPRTWIAAWRHVVTIFRDRGARNVTWLWTINALGADVVSPRKFWPGSGYVTWVGIDGYYNSTQDSFATVFEPTVTAVREFTGKPVLVSETATYPGAISQITGLFAGIRRDHLLGLVWYDVWARNDWRLEDNLADLAVFRQELKGYP